MADPTSPFAAAIHEAKVGYLTPHCAANCGAQAAGLERGEDLLLVLTCVARAAYTVGFDDAGGGVVGIGHDHAA